MTMKDSAKHSKMMVELWQRPGFRDENRKRVREGMAKARASGKTLGRPKKTQSQ